MKNKRTEQLRKKNLHREQLKKTRRKSVDLGRNEPLLTSKPTILIVCEGENTEPSYFEKFRLSSAVIKAVGLGSNTTALVKQAIRLSNEKKYDQVWCVFDADPKPDNPKQAANFNQAVKIAKQKKFNVGWSNQAFEYWIILHLDDHQGSSVPRSDYHDKINNLINPHGLSYDGKDSKMISQELFDYLNNIDPKTGKIRVRLAIERSEKISKNCAHLTPAKAESSTTVHLLVSELLKYI